MSKHQFTCADVIYLRKRARRNNLINLAVGVVSIGSLWVVGTIAERKDRKAALEFTPEDLEV